MIVKKIVAVLVAVVIAVAVLPIFGLLPNDRENTLNVVVLAGQSNIAYVPQYMDIDTVNSEISAPGNTCYYFGNSEVPVRDGFNLSQCGLYSMYNNGAWSVGGEDAITAYTISEYADTDVLVINAGIPGRPIMYFEPVHTGGEWIKAVIETALSLIPDTYTVNKCGWVWCQGESDKLTPVNDYIQSFSLINGLFNDLGFNHCAMVETKPIDSGNATQAQTKIVNMFNNVSWGSRAPAGFTVANGLLIEGNSLHYSQSGRNIVGEQCATVLENYALKDYGKLPVFAILNIIPLLIVAGLVGGSVIWFIARKR